MRKIIILTSFLFYFFISCNQPSPATTFEKDGISLICPSGWKIVEEVDFGNGEYYLSIGKSGFFSSGLMTLSWFSSELDLSECINAMKDELKSRHPGIIFSEAYESHFNGIEAISVGYTFNSIKVEYRGFISFFYKKGKTFTILRQEAIEDEAKNAEGFKIIEENFKVE